MSANQLNCLRLFLAAAAVAILAAPALAQAEPKAEVRWAESLEKAFSQAKITNKPVFVDIYADWCGWCKKLERDVFPQSKVSALLNERFTPVRIDADRNPEFAQKYNIPGLPTLLILEADGTEAGRIGGYMEAGPFAERLEAILKGREEKARLEAAVASNPDSAPARYSLGMLAWEMDRYKDTVEHLGKAVELDPELKTINGEQALIALAQAHALTNNLAQGTKILERFMTTFPNSKQLYHARFLYGTMLYEQGKFDQAKQSLQAVADAPEGWVPRELRTHAKRLLAEMQ